MTPFVGRRLDSGRQHQGSVDQLLARQRLQPSLGGELCSPDDVDAHHVVVGVLGLEVLNQVIVLLVGLVGLLLESHLLRRVRRVPPLDQRLDNVAVVLALDVGDRTTAGQATGSRATGGGGSGSG